MDLCAGVSEVLNSFNKGTRLFWEKQIQGFLANFLVLTLALCYGKKKKKDSEKEYSDSYMSTPRKEWSIKTTGRNGAKEMKLIYTGPLEQSVCMWMILIPNMEVVERAG